MATTPRTERIYIGIYGRCNSGKSSLVNALTGQQTAVVSAVAGTTTDPVSKNMELPGLGAAMLIDTAGLDDRSELAAERLAKTRREVDRTDIAVMVFDAGACDADYTIEQEWIAMLRARKIPVVAVLGKTDLIPAPQQAAERIQKQTGLLPVVLSAHTGEGIDHLRQALASLRSDTAEVSITGNLVHAGDVVMLVMPQDAAAPKGRLILPQVQTLRELLDKGAIPICCTPERMAEALRALSHPPHLVITDSQAFAVVSQQTPAESLLTSFSVLFARYKGDLKAFVTGASAIDRLTPHSRVLIAEACTHAPAEEDIGRVKIPNMLRKKIGDTLRVDIVSGADFPDDLTPYELVIHCGACMFNRRHVLSRVSRAAEQHIPITNYGVAIAHLTGILARVAHPKNEEQE